MKKTVAGLLAALVGGAFAATTSYTFNGSVNDDWFTAGNWTTTTGTSPYPHEAEGANGDDAVLPPGKTVVFDPEGTEAADVPAETFIRMIQAGSANSTTPVTLQVKSGTLTVTDLFRLGRSNGPVQVVQDGGIFRSISPKTAIDAYCFANQATSEGIWCEFILNDGLTDLSTAAAALTVGQSGNGRLTVNGGRLVTKADLTLAHNSAGVGELLVTGGEVSVGDRLRLSRSGVSRVVLSGGTVKVKNATEVGKRGSLTLCGTARLETANLRDGSYQGGAGGVVLFDGGTLVKKGTVEDFVGTSLQQVYVGEHATTFEISEGDAGKIAVPMLPSPDLAEGVTDGGFVKTGAGTLTIAPGTSLAGTIYVNEGTLIVSLTDVLDIRVADGATLLYQVPEVFTLSMSLTPDLVARMKEEAVDNTLVVNVGDNAEVVIPDAFTLEDGWTLCKRGNGTLVLRGANDWNAVDVRLEMGLLVGELGVGVPASSHVTFANGSWAPLTASFTWTFGNGPGAFSVAEGCGLSITALERDLVLDFGGAGETLALANDLYLNPRNGDRRITVMNGFATERSIFACAGEIVFTKAFESLASLTTRDTAQVALPPSASAKQINASHQANAVSTVELDGGSWTIIDSGFVNPFLLAGQDGVTGEQATFNFKSGAFTVLDGNTSTVGRGADALGVFNQTGGDASFKSALMLGENGTGRWTLSAGTLTVGGAVTLAKNATATGELTVTGTGVATLNGAVNMTGAAGARATVTVADGGVLEATSFAKTAEGATALVVDGGTIRVTGEGRTVADFFKAFDSVTIGANGLVLDVADNNLTDAFGAGVVLNGPIVKKGAGALSLTPEVANGRVIVEEGTVQVLPSNIPGGQLGRNRWTFDGDFKDSVGGADAVPVGEAIAFDAETGSVVLAGTGKRTTYLDLSAAAFTEVAPATFEFWATLDEACQSLNGKLFCYGNSSAKSIFINFSGGVKCGGSFQSGKLGQMQDGQLWHFSIVVEPQDGGKSKVTFRRMDADGTVLAEYAETQTFDLGTYNQTFWLGDAVFATGENDMLGSFREVRVWKKALSVAELALSCKAGPDVLPAGFVAAKASFAVKTGATVALDASLAPANYAITFSDDAATIADYLHAHDGVWTLLSATEALTADRLPRLPDLKPLKLRAEIAGNELLIRPTYGTTVLVR